MPEKFPVKQLYRFYFKHVMPKIGMWLSKDDGAYSYLPASVEKFPKPSLFSDMLTSFGLKTLQVKSLSLGIATLYVAIKA
jgi:demethylmenaquinone methyltransferase/2-methoxy-6-polyprenyl-1,4-benzoquinol methylase